MGGSHFSRVNENAREQVLSGDLNRGLDLHSREIQDSLAYLSSDFDSNAPFSGAIQLPPVTGDAGGFTATVGAGRGFSWDPTFPGLTADDSAYLVLRWASTLLTFASPDSTNGRIDVICGTVTGQDTDLQSRNILVDPTTRSITPNNVFKTSNPLTVLSVVTGTAAGSPQGPTIPAHLVPIYEVYVPPGVANASFFRFFPRLWRKALYPMSAINTVVSDCKLLWDMTVDPASVAAEMSMNNNAKHAAIIDGEMITWTGSPKVVQDSTANPFGSAAPATAARPYYVYLCAGRNQPQLALGGTGLLAGALPLPVVLVESTVPPDPNGRPSGTITTPRGTTQRGALYVGLGFVYRGTTNRQNCIQAGGITWAARGVLEALASATSPTVFLSIPAPTSHSDLTAKVRCVLSSTGAQINAGISINPSAAGVPAGTGLGTIDEEAIGASGVIGFVRTLDIPLGVGSNGIAWLTYNASNVGFTILGYSHGVHRLAG